MDQTARITWKDGEIPVSERFDDPYFSLTSGLDETRHVFIAGNDLVTRLCPEFHIAELGFGTGLNALAVAAAWDGPGTVRFTSFEAYPMSLDDMTKALGAFEELAPFAAPLLSAWAQGARRFQLGGVEVDVIVGDANETLSNWSEHVDAWFLDGFSPAKNPELWNDALMGLVGQHTKPQGSFATYTAAGHVRRALDEAGFDVERTAGFGRKRHMSRGIKRSG